MHRISKAIHWINLCCWPSVRVRLVFSGVGLHRQTKVLLFGLGHLWWSHFRHSRRNIARILSARSTLILLFRWQHPMKTDGQKPIKLIFLNLNEAQKFQLKDLISEIFLKNSFLWQSSKAPILSTLFVILPLFYFKPSISSPCNLSNSSQNSDLDSLNAMAETPFQWSNSYAPSTVLSPRYLFSSSKQKLHLFYQRKLKILNPMTRQPREHGSCGRLKFWPGIRRLDSKFERSCHRCLMLIFFRLGWIEWL